MVVTRCGCSYSFGMLLGWGSSKSIKSECASVAWYRELTRIVIKCIVVWGNCLDLRECQVKCLTRVDGVPDKSVKGHGEEVEEGSSG